MLKIDCHFHPNLLFSLNKRGKIENIWNRFKEHSLDAVLVCEHVYKKPVWSFHQLKQLMPNEHKTILIPWAECLTKEWIDVVVFGKEVRYNNHLDILIPKKYTFDELISYVDNQNDIQWVVTHPYLPSKTAIWKHITHTKLIEICKNNKIVEISNWSFVSTRIILEKLWLIKLFPKIKQRLKKIEDCNTLTWEFEDKICLVWSDAHHIWDIWMCLQIEDNHWDQDVFTQLMQHKKGYIHIPDKSFFDSTILLLKSIITVFLEGWIKRLYLYKMRNDW